MSSQSNERRSVEYLTMPNRAWLGWYVQEESTRVPGRIMEISSSGVSVLVEEAPPLEEQQTAWVRMEEPTQTEWVEAVVTGVTEVNKRGLIRRGPVVGHLVHLQFAGPYPYDFFKAATHATQLSERSAAGGLTESEKAFWR